MWKLIITTLSVEKNPVKSDQFLSGDQQFYPTKISFSIFMFLAFRLLFFLLSKIQITEILEFIP